MESGCSGADPKLWLRRRWRGRSCGTREAWSFWSRHSDRSCLQRVSPMRTPPIAAVLAFSVNEACSGPGQPPVTLAMTMRGKVLVGKAAALRATWSAEETTSYNDSLFPPPVVGQWMKKHKIGQGPAFRKIGRLAVYGSRLGLWHRLASSACGGRPFELRSLAWPRTQGNESKVI